MNDDEDGDDMNELCQAHKPPVNHSIAIIKHKCLILNSY